jgi:hypothetical protein
MFTQFFLPEFLLIRNFAELCISFRAALIQESL